ncbi:hypothetical protein B484DRAFT_404574 [Ochromonadaceae sp. CCMP2298]|nr:hypothetical protein B484DRAFT_404574 [Ochromonadaceae sp. CCMP2298]
MEDHGADADAEEEEEVLPYDDNDPGLLAKEVQTLMRDRKGEGRHRDREGRYRDGESSDAKTETATEKETEIETEIEREIETGTETEAETKNSAMPPPNYLTLAAALGAALDGGSDSASVGSDKGLVVDALAFAAQYREEIAELNRKLNILQLPFLADNEALSRKAGRVEAENGVLSMAY